MYALGQHGRADPVWLSKLLSLIVSMKPYHDLPIISVYATQTRWDSENHGQSVARISSSTRFFNTNFELVFSDSFHCFGHCWDALFTTGTRCVCCATPLVLWRRRAAELFVRDEEGPMILCPC